ncbi:MAG: radical SAM protein [Candidatus Woesearchaeota archaeon]|nr:radical SAM protein [Candidatus Woesearchaeota archaeon]
MQTLIAENEIIGEDFSEVVELLPRAQKIFAQRFPAITNFERAIFFSWGCTIGDCQFCYMSAQPTWKKPSETKRSRESIFAEVILAKQLGWDIGFFTGGIGVFTPNEIEDMLKVMSEIAGEKIWLSVGPVPKPLLLKYLPYLKGIVGSTETINPELHKKVCPSKPLEPYEKMFSAAQEMDIRRAMTFIVGMGEKKSDLSLLVAFIKKYDISKIHLYGLIPTKGTAMEHYPVPSADQQAWWIAQLRIACPTLDIQCGIWEDRTERISYLLQAGANSISKFQAIKFFGTSIAQEIEAQAHNAGREFKGTLTKLPDIDWENEVKRLSVDEALKKGIQEKLSQYLRQIEKSEKKRKK